MAKDYLITPYAHPNIYNQYSDRKFNVYFSEPENGVNEETGLLLFIPGFGGNAHSNVYKKMRAKFADDYNLITIQCDYFGQEFMQDSSSTDIHIPFDIVKSSLSSTQYQGFLEVYEQQPNNTLQFLSQYSLRIPIKEKLNESIENFNDMGIMQAMDNINAVLMVMAVLNDNNLNINLKKVIIYGNSHGSYLSYLCNAFAPQLFTLIIDNSSWLFPAYLTSLRYLYRSIGNVTIGFEFDYMARQIDFDTEILDLRQLYNNIINECNIICFHGTTDNLISHTDKRKFCGQITNCDYHEIDERKVDSVIFKSTNHGLDADFLQLFNHAMNTAKFEKDSRLKLYSSKIITRKYYYYFHYDSYVLSLKRVNKQESNSS